MEHIDITTRLMRNAAQHSRVTAPVMLLGGIFSVTIGTASSILYNMGSLDKNSGLSWLLPWAMVLILTLVTLIIFANRYSSATGQNALNPGFKTVLRSMLPALLGGSTIAFSATVLDITGITIASPLLLVFYSLALFSIRLFTPKSVRLLSILLLALGLTFWFTTPKLVEIQANIFHLANFHMIFGFGLLHIITGAGSLLFERSQLPPLNK